MNFYTISQIPQRQQIAQHFHSSIQQPNLSNVEAQLFAVRNRNYELSKQYFQNKYGNGQLFNSYVQKHNLEGLGAPQQPVYDFKRELNKKAIEIQQQEMQIIHNKKKRVEHSEENKEGMKLTVPQPFSFEKRQKQRKLQKQKQLSKSQQKIVQPSQFQKSFKAKPVPSKVSNVGYFEQMKAQQEKKRQDRKRSRTMMNLANVQSFSFENRKVNKKQKPQKEQFVFKASPIPWYCSVDLLKKKQDAQIIRKQKIAKTAQQHLAKAKLPPRMEKDYLQKEAKKVMSPDIKQRQTQSALKVRDPPDFQKIHKNFEEAMQRKRKQNKNTQIKEFKFYSTAKDSFSKIKEEEKPQQHLKKSRAIPQSTLKSNIDIFAQSTIKFSQEVEKRHKQMEEKRKKELKKKMEDEERQKIDQTLKKRVQDAAKREKQNKQKQIAQKNKQSNAKQLAQYNERKQEIIDRARKQPLLVERISKRDEKIEKMKKLWQISQTLKKNGIKGKQHDHYFKRQQLLLLQDYKQLKQKI